jgi:hypothetical protein
MLSHPSADLAARRVRYQLARLQTTPQLTAIIDCLFDLPRRTEPAFDELMMVDERLLFARASGDESFRHFVGRRDQLTTTLMGFLRHLHFGSAERSYVRNRIEAIARRRAR